MLRRLVGASPAPHDFHDVLVGMGARGDFQLTGLKLVRALSSSDAELLQAEPGARITDSGHHSTPSVAPVLPVPKAGTSVLVIAVSRLDGARMLRSVLNRAPSSKDSPKSLQVVRAVL